MRGLGLGMLLLCAACINPSTNTCGALACPGSDVCSADQTCVTVDQLAACSGVADGAKCTFASSSGFCHHGACVESLDTCGDGVAKLSLDELCDCGSPDLLQAPPLGCSAFNSDGPGATCRSDCRPARCGDGIIDTNELCDDGNTIPGDGCRGDCQGRFTKLQTPTGASLFGVVTFGPTDTYAFGNGGALHFDGSSWTTADIGVSARAVWSNGPNEIYVAGTGGAANNGVLAYFNGSIWTTLDPTTDALADVWASSPSNIYVVSQFGVIRHFTGTWADVVVPCMYGGSAVAGTGPSNVYVATGAGLCHFDGGGWTKIDQGPVTKLRQTSPTEVTALTSAYPVTSLRTWTDAVGGPTIIVPGDPLSFGLTEPGELLAFGGNGLVLQYKDQQWTHLVTPTEGQLNAMSATSPTNVFIVGIAGTVLH